MNRNYQQESYANGSFEQDYQQDSYESRQRKEYRDLYDPFKSNWNAALNNAGRRGSESVPGLRMKSYPSTHEHSSTSTYRNRYGNHSGGPRPYKDRRKGDLGYYSPYESGNVKEGKFSSSDIEGGSRFEPTIEGGNFNEAGDVPRRNTYGYFTTGYGPRD
ncbi:hypothetical protein ACFSRY_14780 [Pontibacter locisalis]|uniref:Uncharacterized protein n=1 Tax=Pontibacter locisalis TaxID=1719035 RepID=A0ABW5ISZ9_9BACT